MLIKKYNWTSDTSSLSLIFLHVTLLHCYLLQTKRSFIKLLFLWEPRCSVLLRSEWWWVSFSATSRRKPEITIVLTLYAVWTWKHLKRGLKQRYYYYYWRHSDITWNTHCLSLVSASAFLKRFRKLRKGTLSFIMPIRLFVSPHVSLSVCPFT
jgi:hypothetical protein